MIGIVGRQLCGAGVLLGMLLTGACSGEDADGLDGGDGGVDGSAAGDGDTDADGDGDGDTDTDCGEQEIDLELAGVKVMLLVDASGSMNDDIAGGADKWSATTDAIEMMVNHPELKDTWFGLHVFPNMWLDLVPTCDTEPSPVIEVAPNTGQQIVEWMRHNPPSTVAFTPLLDGLEYYLGAIDTPLQDAKTANYIVLLSDGADNCYQTLLTDPYRKLNVLAGIADDLKDISHIKTVVVGLGDEVSEEELNAVAQNGGSTFGQFIPATDSATLNQAFEEIAKSIRPCRYLLTSPSTIWDSTKVNFYFDGEVVERDRKHLDGWDWTKNDELEVEFYGPACQKIKDNLITDVRAQFGCPTQIDGEVCATYESFLPFPEVAVAVLEDFSSSMTGEKWKVASTALTQMLVNDRNNPIEFGFDTFPDASVSLDFCDVADSPLFTIGGQLNHLPIIKWCAEHLDPLLSGSTPLHAILARLINRPGKLADPDVSGAAVVITDGEDSCYEPIEEVVPALTQTVEKVVEMHDVRIFAIGYGDDANEEQLNAIAQAGNTGLSTYLHADDLASLEGIFEQIANMVTSCLFTVPNPGASVDYNLVNIYFDGDVVPRDVNHLNGWDWFNNVNKNKIEFYGSYCDALKSGAVRDVVIEFGCETVIVE